MEIIMYKVIFQFLNESGKWKEDHLDNNGRGYNYPKAKSVYSQLKNDNVCIKKHLEIVKQ